ncbi:MAG: hypothetical protein KDD36_09270 [Flavobacteriales bacterium]|nr:hypothetical protein [Flavobacteriales bacterium]
MKDVKIQLLEKEVAAPGDTIRISEDLDKDYKKLTGISFLDNIGLDNILRSISLDGDDLFPKDFEVAFLQTSPFVAPDERFYSLDKMADGKKLEIDFQDDGTGSYPKTIRVYLRLEND